MASLWLGQHVHTYFVADVTEPEDMSIISDKTRPLGLIVSIVCLCLVYLVASLIAINCFQKFMCHIVFHTIRLINAQFVCCYASSFIIIITLSIIKRIAMHQFWSWPY